eukprot:3617447-Alexandrium_andersonii.AAC.1
MADVRRPACTLQRFGDLRDSGSRLRPPRGLRSPLPFQRGRIPQPVESPHDVPRRAVHCQREGSHPWELARLRGDGLLPGHGG